MSLVRSAAGIVFALPIEADAFARLVCERVDTRGGGLPFHEGTVGGKRVAWCVGGVGPERATRATRLLIDGHRPRRVISAGFAGGLDPGLPRGGLIEPVAVRGEKTPTPLRLAAARGEPVGAQPLIVTLDRIARTVADKAELAAATGAVLVDMETLAVAEVAAAAGLPCYGLRVVSDAATDELPPDVGRLLRSQSTAKRAGMLLGMLGKRPGAAGDLWQLWERAVVDGCTLATGLTSLIETFPPELESSAVRADREPDQRSVGQVGRDRRTGEAQT
jgi:adenosylhomocysteine nucleosidase